MINSVTIIGRVTNDIEVKTTTNGISYCRFNIAVNKMFSEGSDFFTVQAWRAIADLCGKYVKKGDKLGINGSLQSRDYDYNGEKRKAIEIVAMNVEFLSTSEQKPKPQQTSNNSVQTNMDLEPLNIDDDDLPF